jgi:hypothetical protein
MVEIAVIRPNPAKFGGDSDSTRSTPLGDGAHFLKNRHASVVTLPCVQDHSGTPFSFFPESAFGFAESPL